MLSQLLDQLEEKIGKIKAKAQEEQTNIARAQVLNSELDALLSQFGVEEAKEAEAVESVEETPVQAPVWP